MFPAIKSSITAGRQLIKVRVPFDKSFIIQTRQINLERLSNKRITRLESNIELESNDYKTRLINRNPRNLEQLSFERKPAGFWLDRSPSTHYWNKLVFMQTGRYLETFLQHWSGKKLVKASTREPQLAKYFKNPSTTQAAIILAKTIAIRCLQSGYLYAEVDNNEVRQDSSIKIKTFFETLESNGLVLKEPPEIVPRIVSDL